MSEFDITESGQFIITEFVISLLVGGAPLLLSFHMAGIQGLELMLSNLLPSNLIIYWSIALTVVGVCVEYLYYLILTTSDIGESIWAKLQEIASQIATSVLMILRICAGVLFAFVALWVLFDYTNLNRAQALMFVVSGLVALFQAVLLRTYHYYIEMKLGRP